MTRLTAADKSAPLTDDLLLEERIGFLLRRANIRQFWMLFLGDDDVQSDLIMPCDDLPSTPDQPTQTDAGTHAAGELFGVRVASLMSEVGLAQAVFVWERPGDETVGEDERRWARALAESCHRHGARIRAQFLLHDDGVRPLTPDDYLSDASRDSNR